MSAKAKLTLGASVLFATGTIWFVHYNQQAERNVREFSCFLSTVMSPLLSLSDLEFH